MVTGTTGSRGITITLNGDLTVGATFELVSEAYNATLGKGFVQLQQSTFSPVGTSFWRAESGTVTIEAIQGKAIKISSTALPMTVSSSNAPGNVGTGTFTAKIEAQVLEVSGLE